MIIFTNAISKVRRRAFFHMIFGAMIIIIIHSAVELQRRTIPFRTVIKYIDSHPQDDLCSIGCNYFFRSISVRNFIFLLEG
jgi:hypothetical protein